MSETLSCLFQKSHGAAIEIDGLLVWPICQQKIAQPMKKFLVRRLGSTHSPVQGVRIKAAKGTILVDGHSHPDIILWADTSPAAVEIVVRSKIGCELNAWNVWRSGDRVDAWTGNAGMLIHKADGVVTLECSDGKGEIDFTDLVVQIAACD